MNNERTVLVELNEKELRHLINDTIDYIWDIKKAVFGDDWNFGTNISEVEKLTEEQKEKLTLYGYYSRKELLDKLKELESKEFSELNCCG